MTKHQDTSFYSNPANVLEWVNSQSGPFTNVELYDAFPTVEPNNLRIILYRLYHKGLIDKLATGLYGPKGIGQLKHSPKKYPVLRLKPGTQIHLVHEAIRALKGPVTVFQLSRATGLSRNSIYTHLNRLKSANLVSNPSRGVWVFNS